MTSRNLTLEFWPLLFTPRYLAAEEAILMAEGSMSVHRLDDEELQEPDPAALHP